LLSKNIPYLQKLKFDSEKPTSWKLLYKIKDTLNASDKILIEKIKKFTSERTAEKLSYSLDNYVMDEVLLILHGIPSEEKAKDIVTILQDYNDFKIKEPVLIVSTENYKVIQIQKNLETYGKSNSEVKTVDAIQTPEEPKTEVTPVPSAENKTKPVPSPNQEKLNPTSISNETVLPTKKP
jgi:hypothetical protein